MAKKARSLEEIQKAFDSVTPEVKRVIDGPELVALIPTMGAKHHLHVDQMGALEAEITDVLIGFEQTKDFAANVAKSLQINESQANEIARDVSDMLFEKIRNSMKSAPAAASEKSVVMPSSMPVSSSVTPAKPAAAQPAPIASQSASKVPEIHAADLMLTQPTISNAPKTDSAPRPSIPPAAPAPKAEAPKPVAYKVDPYREQPE